MVDFLLEIGTEDMPYNHLKEGLSQLSSGLEKLLSNHKIVYEDIKELGTLRRLSILIKNISLQEKPEEEIIIGPPLQVAIDKDGKPTQSLMGFLNAKNANLNNVEYIDIEKGTYVCIKRRREPRSTKEILEKSLDELILSIHFPKTMRWEGNIRFTRPIRNILCLLNNEIVNFSIGNITSSSFSFGHRIWGKEKIQISTPEEYVEKLRENYVIVDPIERRKIILNEIEKIEKEKECNVIYDEETIDYWIYSVEFPYLFLGSFSEEHLTLPPEIIGYVIGKNQKFFPVLNTEGFYLPFFIGVADSANDLRSFIVRGNEKVINARLSDARFFWEKDREIPFEARWQELSKVIYQEKLGTYLDKSQRISELSLFLSEILGIGDRDSIRMTSQYCKADLVTEMVKEFPALQGVIGGLYLKEEGYPENIWKGVYEHYKPQSLEDSPPSTIEGAIISIADKIDHIVGALGVGIEFSGSSDPFALRKAELGICKTILHYEMSLSINQLVERAIKILNNLITKDPDKLKEEVLQFFEERLEFVFHEWMGFRKDLVRAVFASGIDNIHHLHLKLKALDKILDTPLLKAIVLAHKRIKNIISGQSFSVLNESLLNQKEEMELLEIYKELERDAERLLKEENFEAILELFLQIEPFINNFFERVLVMVEDNEIRSNRISLLFLIHSLFLSLADFSQITIL
ncbi:MAG: glycine--tRNA ligase subunit beta [Candidatus Aminicenantia bacterium]